MTKVKNPKKKQNLQGTSQIRLKILFVILLLLVVATLSRTFFLQVRKHDIYEERAHMQQMQEKKIAAHRGMISFAQGTDEKFLAAINRKYFLAYIAEPDVPEQEKDAVAQRIAHELSIEKEIVRKKLARIGDPYEVIKRKITTQEKEHLSTLEIKGLHFEQEQWRYYPGGSLGAHVLGFVGSDGATFNGRYGVEKQFEDELLGTEGIIEGLRDAHGGWNTVSDRNQTPQKDGVSLELTIDRTLQQETEKILQEDAETYGADKGLAIIMEVSTGKILAMAQTPTFSLNEYGKVDDLAIYRNSAISDPYESGSVFKTFTLAMGLDQGVITPESTYVDKGFVEAAEYKLRNAEDKVYGLQTMTKVLEESINTGVVHVLQLVGNKRFKEYTEQFGFGSITGIELPTESPGSIKNISNVKKFVDYFTASYGQGISVTPIQLVQAYGALANDGIMMQPRILEKRIFADGTQKLEKAQEVRRVVSQEASRQITQMLYEVVAGGHASLASVPGYRVGGKTGTAQVAKSESLGYEEDQKNTTFVGYAPIPDKQSENSQKPQYVILVKYENPVNVEWAATSASPTFGRIMKFLLEYKKVRPTEEITKKKEDLQENPADEKN